MPTSHADVVAQVKDTLLARGEDLSGPCGALKIIRHVAWILRAEGAGLLAKPTGNNCDGLAVDIICYQNGDHYDVLSDSGGTNGPAWTLVGQYDVSRWRAPTNPGDIPTPAPTPASCDCKPCPCDISGVQAQIDALTSRIQALHDKLDALMVTPQPVAPDYVGTLFGIRLVLHPSK